MAEQNRNVLIAPVIAGKLRADGCDFNCGKKGEPLISFHNTDSGNRWVCHLSCLRENLEVQEELLADERN